jgi:simple sugar transport system permease protein
MTAAASTQTASAPRPRFSINPVTAGKRIIRPILSVAAALAVFAALALAQNAPIGGIIEAFTIGLNNPNFWQQTVVRAVPLMIAAVGVAIPARAGLVNVGAEGQLIAGSVAAAGVGLLVGSAFPGPLSWLVCAVAGMLAGGVVAGFCAYLRVRVNAPEAVTSLLINFILLDVMLFLLYQPWKDPNGSGQPQTRPLEPAVMLPMLPGTRISIAILVALAVCGFAWWLATRTDWGFRITVAGGNPEAAVRSGISITKTSVQAMALGGGLAGLGGALNLIGLEGQLRPDILTSFGFIAFLAAFVARSNILGSLVAAFCFAALMVASNPLQLRAGLDGSAVYVLLGLACLALTALASTLRTTR